MHGQSCIVGAIAFPGGLQRRTVGAGSSSKSQTDSGVYRCPQLEASHSRKEIRGLGSTWFSASDVGSALSDAGPGYDDSLYFFYINRPVA